MPIPDKSTDIAQETFQDGDIMQGFQGRADTSVRSTQGATATEGWMADKVRNDGDVGVDCGIDL